MATRKQKHAAAVARREEFYEEYRQLGRDAIQAGAERRRIAAEKAKAEADKINARHQRILSGAAVDAAGQELLDRARSPRRNPSRREREVETFNNSAVPSPEANDEEDGIDLTRIAPYV